MSNNPLGNNVLAQRGSPNKKYIIRLTQYMKHRLLDLRFWYESKNAGESCMTKKGIMLSRENYLLTLKTLANRHEDILDWFGIEYVPESVIKYDMSQVEAREKAEMQIRRITSSDQSNKSIFYDAHHKAGNIELIYNSLHPIFRRIEHLETKDEINETKDLISCILVAFELARQSMLESTTSDPEIFLDQLKYNWSLFLERYLTHREKQ